MSLDKVLNDIIVERQRQDAKWGADRQLPANTWHVILSEEVGECAEAVLEKDFAHLREELVQVAAVAVATIEALDRHNESELLKTLGESVRPLVPIDGFQRVLTYRLKTGKTWKQVSADLGVSVGHLMMAKSGRRGFSDKVLYRLTQLELKGGAS